jgi:hypothetical protein
MNKVASFLFVLVNYTNLEKCARTTKKRRYSKGELTSSYN